MAKMIPPVIGAHVVSDGEREIFEALKTEADASDWVVLHSLDVANHRLQVSGEIDFVIIAPRLGVVCLEVKACRSLEIRDGRWRYGQSARWDDRGPFKQAATAMHSLRHQLVNAEPRFSGIVFCSAVAFTHMSFNVASPEWHRWQALGRDYLRTRGVAAAIASVLRNMRLRLAKTPSARWFRPDNVKPSRSDIKRLVSILRPNFESYESPRARVKRVKEEAKKYTEGQFRALDFAEGNERVIFGGPAGTGKTLLAIEAARRAERLGRRTLFLCYNELLGVWLREEVSPLASMVDFDRIARRMLQVSGLSARQDPEFWSTTLPLAAVAALEDNPDGRLEPYEQLIVDEAQDFLRNGYIDFLDRSVIGGLQHGRVMLFGDFERQAVYRAADLTLAELREGWIPDLASFRLRDNCRNTPRVAALASILGGLDPGYRSVMREDDQVDPTIIQYGDDAEQTGKLIQTVLDLLDEGFELSDIAVLSMRPLDMCMNRILGESQRPRFSGGEHPGKSGVFNTSIRRFKGLEAAVIVVTDIDEIVSEEAQKLFYVAVTRAIDKLVLLIRSGARQEYVTKLQGGVA